MKNNEIKADAAQLVNAFDAGELAWTGCARTAGDLADFWIEHQFARVDVECDWSDAKCARMAGRMTAQLKAMGLP